MSFVSEPYHTETDTIAFALNLIFAGDLLQAQIEFRVGDGYDAYQFGADEVLGLESDNHAFDWRFLRDAATEKQAVRFGPVLRQPGTAGHGRKSDLLTASCFFADADGGQDLTWLMRSCPPPSVVIQSSPGNYHFYWGLRSDSLFDMTDRDQMAQYEGYQKGLAQMLGCKWMPASQLMRWPGSFNDKYTPAVQVQVLYTDYRAVYGLDDLVDFPYIAPPRVVRNPYVPPEAMRVDTDGLTAGMAHMLANPYDVARGRNDAIFRVARQLCEQGVSMGQAETLINREIARCRLYDTFVQTEVEQAILSGYRKNGGSSRRLGFVR